MTTKPQLEKLDRLQEFYETHVLIKHKYMIIISKCGKDDFKFGCSPLRMPREAFASLRSRPQLVPFPTHTMESGADHFAKYAELSMIQTSDKHMPSYRYYLTVLPPLPIAYLLAH